MPVRPPNLKPISVEFGTSYTGLATVGYELRQTNVDNTTSQYQARTTVGVVELGGGTYEFYVPRSFQGYAVVDTGGGSPVYRRFSIESDVDAHLKITGTVAAATSVTELTLSAEFPAATDALDDRFLVVLTGAYAGLANRITGYTSGRVATFGTAWPAGAVTAGDTVQALGMSA